MELLKQNLAIEPDLQNFIGFALESVGKLGGNAFSASIASLEVMKNLRSAGAGTGYPLPASLLLQGNQLVVSWGEPEKEAKIAYLPHPPEAELILQLRQHLQDSTESADPAILLQRNAEMARHLDETRIRTEKEVEALQRTLEKRLSELHESLHQAETDPLTGLFNRRAFDEKLGQAFRHTLRQRAEPLSLLLFDLDYFKSINDEFGHQYGDAYLNKMAHAMLSVIREGVDFAFRFGGDEFAMMVFANHNTACDKARKVLELMDNKVSIGIAAIEASTSDSLTLEDFIRIADNALYEAKRRGRGRVVVAPCHEVDSSDCSSSCQKITGSRL